MVDSLLAIAVVVVVVVVIILVVVAFKSKELNIPQEG